MSSRRGLELAHVVAAAATLWRALSGEFEEHQRAGRGGSKIR